MVVARPGGGGLLERGERPGEQTAQALFEESIDEPAFSTFQLLVTTSNTYLFNPLSLFCRLMILDLQFGALVLRY